MANPRELAEKAFALMQDALRDSEARAAQLDEELTRRRNPENGLEEQVESLRQRLGIVEAERERWMREAGQLEEVAAAERAKLDQLKKKLEVAESGPEKLTKKEINFWRTKADELDRVTGEYKTRLAQLRHELNAREALIRSLTSQAVVIESGAAEAAQRLASLETEKNRVDAELAESNSAAVSLGQELETVRGEFEHAAETREAQSRELSDQRVALDHIRETLKDRDAMVAALAAEAEQLRAQLGRREESDRQLRAELEQTTSRASEQIAGLEQELREEKECTDNISEIANERRELISQLEDRLAEAEERYEEAKWRLGKAQHFERLVRRRKGLIDALIERIRSKSKANTALKAGLDGLRTYKAASEAKQHELLGRIDSLKAKIKEQEETITRHHGATLTKEQLAASESRLLELEKRLEDQVEIIQALEEELKTSKAKRHAHTERHAEVERLQRDLAAKNDIIEKLQEDADAQQRKLAKLRGSESETVRLRAVSEHNQGQIDALEREIALLRETLARKESAGGRSDEESASDARPEDDQMVRRLKTTIKEHEATIAQLTESADGWKRKYEFLSSDSSGAYRATAEK